MKHDTQRTDHSALSSTGSEASSLDAGTGRSPALAKDLHLEPELPTTWDDWKSVRDLG